jgi:hypothetical protein
MKTMKVPRGTARTARRAAGFPIRAPSLAAQAAMLSDRLALNRKMSNALFKQHGTNRLPF